MLDVQWLGLIRGVFLPVFPGAHEGVLENGQLIGIVSNIVEQLLDKARRHLAATDLGRALDGVGALASIEAGDKILSFVHRLSEVLELGAVPEKVGAHGEDNVDGQFFLPTGLED